MKAVIFGAGKIGCGFAGQLLRASGYELVFIGRNQEMITELNRLGSYSVDLMEGIRSKTIVVDRVRGIANSNSDKVVEDLADADLVVTAVGPGNLPAVAPLIAEGLQTRKLPVNIIAFENLPNAGPFLRKLVVEELPQGFPIERFGFSGAVVSRAVTERRVDPETREIRFIADPPEQFIVDGRSLLGPLPRVQGMVVTDNFEAYIQRKLFTFSAGHAICAYLGHLKGYHYIHSAIRDPEIRRAVLAAMAEGQRGLERVYGPEVAGGKEDLERIIKRFENAGLSDSVQRVARDPLRKLKAGDRLIGAALLAQEAGISPEMLTLGTVAAFLYLLESGTRADEDLERYLKIDEPGQELCRLSGVEPEQPLCRRIGEAWREVARGFKKHGVLLNIESLMWAWS
jgi:mannitol-1-phosphate 5-dehydrogenase